MNGWPTPPRLHLALGLVSVAVVALQLVLMQLLSLSQWHHFAWMVISVALLGFGAAGTLLALARERLLASGPTLLPLLLFGSAAAMAAAGAGPAVTGGLDTYLLFAEPERLWRLLLTHLLFAVPFFLAALAIGLVFTARAERIGTYYCANLLGSGAGGAAAVLLLGAFHPRHLPAAVALFALAAGLLVLSRQRRGRLLTAALAAGAVTAAGLLHPPPVPLSQYKDLTRTLNLPGARLVAERPSPYGLVQAVSAPGLRHAPGLSLAYRGEVPVRAALFSDGNWLGPVLPWSPAGGHLLDATTAALPYTIATPAEVLVLHAGTLAEAGQALARGARRAVAVEPHRTVLALLAGELAAASGGLLHHPALTAAPLEPRARLATDPTRYDLIVLPTLGAFGGTAGLFALQEQYALTREAFAGMWTRLAPDGLLCVSTWMDYPPRAPLRLAATLVETLEAAGVGDPAAHLAAVRSWGTVTFCLKRSPLTAAEISRVRAFCEAMLFDPLLLPGLSPEERQHHNLLQDDAFFAALDRLFTPQREALYAAYPFRLRPATDDRPFFSQFLRWQSLPHLTRLFGERAVPFLELGYLVVLLTFLQLAATSALLILLPLTRLGWREGGRLRTFLYFGGLAVGYMLFEIVLIHRLVLYLGHPVHAAAAVIGAILVFSGLGSLASSRLPARWSHRAAGAVAALLALYAVLLPPLLQQTIALSLGTRALLTLAILAPPAFAMGFPFPLGLRRLAAAREADVPWAWGINGCLSVAAAALATIIAVEAGFVVVQLVAAGAYAAAALAWLRT